MLGAEDALFAHLKGRATSPKHGVIFTHEYVRGTRPEDRGSAARALAGKLAIAARVDHYAATAGQTCRWNLTSASNGFRHEPRRGTTNDPSIRR